MSAYNHEIHESLLRFKRNNKVKGAAFALFNNKEIIVSDCAGKSTYGFQIDEETLFSVQSISKNVTALAVMIAVEEGLVNLDTVISEYLPSFSVNSCFEENPGQNITLRMLLSHTAGFTHEAPVGNNYDYRSCSDQDHFNSISDTWLKFPPGSDYSYSNLGFDLAAAIVEQKSGIGFDAYIDRRIFGPLGMPSSTIDDQKVLNNHNRTEGDAGWLRHKHYRIPLFGSGAVYTNLKEFTTYVQLLMNYGRMGDSAIIDDESLLEMFKINVHNYGLGTYINKFNNILYINHNGGGFGYGATILWFPEYNLGAILLCNSLVNAFDYCLEIMEEYVSSMGISKDQSVTALFDSLNGNAYENKTALYAAGSDSCVCYNPSEPDWEKYTGKYAIVFEGMDFRWYVKAANSIGLGYQNFKISKEGQYLKYSGSIGEGTLVEYEPGLFFTNDFEAVDLRSDSPTYRNISIRKRK